LVKKKKNYIEIKVVVEQRGDRERLDMNMRSRRRRQSRATESDANGDPGKGTFQGKCGRLECGNVGRNFGSPRGPRAGWPQENTHLKVNRTTVLINERSREMTGKGNVCSVEYVANGPEGGGVV